jgi:hypothetical protein
LICRQGCAFGVLVVFTWPEWTAETPGFGLSLPPDPRTTRKMVRPMATRKIADKIPQRTFVIAAAPGESIWLGQTLLLTAEVACLRTMLMSREGLSFQQNIR